MAQRNVNDNDDAKDINGNADNARTIIKNALCRQLQIMHICLEGTGDGNLIQFYEEVLILRRMMGKLDKLDGRRTMNPFSAEERKIVNTEKDIVVSQLKLLKMNPDVIRSKVALRKQKKK
eukprot:114390_1